MLILPGLEFMSAQNPFQIPDCFKLDIEQRRRERFKKTVVTAVIISAAVVVGLLIEGCVSEKSQAGTGASAAENTVQTPSETVNPAPAPQAPEAPQTISQTISPVPSRPVAPIKTAAPVESSSSTGEAVYFVKSGDTLSHIAKTHNTTVKALKSANELATDRIVVGEKLKIPSA
jgi:LysM repeat protein